MKRIEKTVFISYRRDNFPWALAIYQHLTSRGYDVFFDFLSIDSGAFEQIILENVKDRAHFIVLLTPTSLDRCSDPEDWLRREIEMALDSKRNIIPLMFDGFDFGNPTMAKHLVDKLALLKEYNGPNIYAEYFGDAMNRLRERYLKIHLDDVSHPKSIVEEEAAQLQDDDINFTVLMNQWDSLDQDRKLELQNIISSYFQEAS